jgi:hypothetical protein
MQNYADLEIRILDREAEGYPVELTLNNEQEFPRGYLNPAFLPWVSSISPANDGVRIFNWLFTDEKLKESWAMVRGQQPMRRLRLRIDTTVPELHAIPWEILRDPGDGSLPIDLAAGTATPFSRYWAGSWQPGAPILQRPIRVLVAIASPANASGWSLDPIDVSQEWNLLQQVVKGLEIELTLMPQPCSLLTLEAALKKGYHVLHFIGHGVFDKTEGRTQLYLADANNQVTPVSDEDIAGMLARQLADSGTSQENKLRLVFLASCQTATRSPADAFRGLAPRLVTAGVPAVLAMQDKVEVDTARQFAATFYRQLLQHGQVDLACNEARSALLTAGLPGAAIPVLFSRLRGNQLLGQHGRISGTQEDFWPYLMEKIGRGHCIPFLGPGVNTGLLPSSETIAEKMADKFNYPLPDRQNLARVAQVAAINDPEALCSFYLRSLKRGLVDYLDIPFTDELKRHMAATSFVQTIEDLDWAEKVLTIHENEIHHQLADLRLPLYMTTNCDSFMFEALKHSGLPARQVGLRWQNPQAGTPQYVLSPQPSMEQPVVFHLNGYDSDQDQLDHMVLSENDYLAHFVRLSRDQETILPMNVLTLLSESSFLFLGYKLEDWEFRTILLGLIQNFTQTNQKNKKHVGVQLVGVQSTDEEKTMKYLESYLEEFRIDIYWGTVQQFVSELHGVWEESAKDDWN